MQDFCIGDPTQPIFHWLALGLCVRANTNFKFCFGGEGFALAPRYQHVGIPNAKFWRRRHCPTPTPDARYFASKWNIGFRLYTHQVVLRFRSQSPDLWRSMVGVPDWYPWEEYAQQLKRFTIRQSEELVGCSTTTINKCPLNIVFTTCNLQGQDQIKGKGGSWTLHPHPQT